MTAYEKQVVHLLLKRAASWCCGYVPQEFAKDIEFFDDVENTVAAPLDFVASVDLPANSAILDYEATKPLSVHEELEAISKKISSCRNCTLSQSRIKAVPGEGVENPCVMVIGEGPGEDEDKSGRPFVGKAGQLLDKMLAAIQLSRGSNCYITNIVKCRPPMNRTPLPKEAVACSSYLQAQIHALKPKFILAMGRTAAQNLLQSTQGINALRGKWFDLHGIPLLATYHPSALLRDPAMKAPAWADLKTFRNRLLAEIPDYAMPSEVLP